MHSPRWYQSAIVYQTHVRAFLDANGDGIGDFRGLTSKLGYIRDLGATAVWLLPFYPSPLRDGGYDIADYEGVHPDYGTLEDFDAFVAEAHKKGLRVITELVVNHTSDRHPWFQRARRAPKGSPERDWYVWSETGEEYPDVRIIFGDYEPSNWTWDEAAGAYFWHRFFRHQPDLNWDNPEVEAAVLKVVDFWLERGVDGLRLDAIPYLYQREGTTCENLPETHAALKRLRAHVDRQYTDVMLLAEANQWPEDAVSFFGDGDECHMNFAFPLMPRLYLAAELEDASPVKDILRQMPRLPPHCGWANFLRNHDELTLEMVTHEERARMWAAYGEHPRAVINLGLRRRIAPLMQGDLRKVAMLHGLMLSLEGTPILYYGDEIGMGDDVFLEDRDAMRTPMQWSSDVNAGFSTASPQALYLPINRDPDYRYEAVNVATQERRQGTLLDRIRQLTRARRASGALTAGEQVLLATDAPEVLAVLRRGAGEAAVALTNLSGRARRVTLDLAEYAGRRLESLLDETAGELDATVTEAPMVFDLPPYGLAWYALRPDASPADLDLRGPFPEALTWPEGYPAVRAMLPTVPARAGVQVAALTGDVTLLVGGEGRELALALPRRVAEDEAQVILHTAAEAHPLSVGRPSLEAVRALWVAARDEAVRAVGSGGARGYRLQARGVALADHEIEGEARRVPEGWAFEGGPLRTVLHARPPRGRGAHRALVKALGDRPFLPVTVAHASLLDEDDTPYTVLRVERLPPGRAAVDRLRAWAADDDDAPDVPTALGRTLGELHAALAESPAGGRVALTPYDRRGLYQGLRTRADRAAQRGDEGVRAHLGRLEALLEVPLTGARLRAHGDPSPQSAWWTDDDRVVWLDFAGEPGAGPVERRVPRLPLMDLAALLVGLERALDHEPDRADVAAARATEAYLAATPADLHPGEDALALWLPSLVYDAALLRRGA